MGARDWFGLRALRGRERVELSSTRDADAVLDEMRQLKVRWLSLDPRLDGVEFVVIGKLGPGARIRLVAVRPWESNSWRRVFRGSLTRDPGGCRLTGVMAVPPLVRAVTYCYLLFASCWAIGFVATSLVAFGRGEGSLAFEALAWGSAGILMIGFMGFVRGGAAEQAGPEEEHLLRWLVERMR